MWVIYIPPAFPVCDDETPAVVAVVPAALPLAGRAFAVGPGSGWVLFGVDAVVEAVVFAVAHMGCLVRESRLSVHAGARSLGPTGLGGLGPTGLGPTSYLTKRLPFHLRPQVKREQTKTSTNKKSIMIHSYLHCFVQPPAVLKGTLTGKQPRTHTPGITVTSPMKLTSDQKLILAAATFKLPFASLNAMRGLGLGFRVSRE